MATKKDQHWVEELFPPHFVLSLDNVLNDEIPRDENSQDVSLATQAASAAKDSIFAKFARQVSPLDIDAIKNVYERVWLMMQLKAEEEKKRADDEDAAGRIKFKDTSTSADFEEPRYDIHDPCIWNSGEIEVLRAVFQTTKAENNQLRGELLETQERLRDLEQKYKKERKNNEDPPQQLKEAVKANQRLTILAKNLKLQVDTATKQINFLKQELKEARSEQKSLLKEIHQLRLSSDHQRINRKKAELELQCHLQEALREKKIHEENLKLMHEEDVQFLQKTIDELSSELQKEKEAHERTRRGLNHLRQHFASLPLHDGQQSENVVKEDQLKKWTF